MPGLRLENVSKKFGDVEVLHDVSLSLEEGELLVVLGPSGCGKSTLLRLIAGLEELDRGAIYVGDKRIDQLQPRDRGVAMVFQNYCLYPHMTVEKNLAFPLKIAGLKRAEIEQKVREIAELLGMLDKLKVRPNELSGGQRQRVALGRAIIRQPDLFMLDEPLSNLDADLRGRMRREIVSLQKNLKTTTIHVTHDQAEALTMADRIAVLKDGELLQIGSPETLYNRPINVFVATVLGFPRINIVRARVDGAVLAPFGIELIKLPMPVTQSEVLVGIRPDLINVKDGGEHLATVIESEYLGDQHIVTIELADCRLTVSKIDEPLQVGSKVRLNLEWEEALLFDPNSGQAINPR
ncbi:MAG: ABC transporter ATP-binding protein [candidate division Zixibacteria bacterium]|nr:ABC transporter ATP-binding protein [candidate division Zixibacteria bacterium]